MSVVWWVLGGLLLLLLVSGGYMFVVGCVRNKELPWLDEEGIKKTSFGRFYETICLAHNWLENHDAKDVFIESYDGLRLHGLWIPAENPKATVILAHGYRSSFLLDFAAAFEYYHDLGLNILVPSQRSHGASQGRIITFGVKESGDFARWIAYHNRELSNCDIVLSGMSMGASTVLYLADRELPENVKGIIADCGFTSPKDILAKVYRSVIHLPAEPTVWVANLFAMVFGGFSLYGKDTRKTLACARVPVLMIHGTADDFVPCAMTQEGFDACNGRKDLLLVEGAGHGVSFLKNPQAYSQKVMAFFEENLEEFHS